MSKRKSTKQFFTTQEAAAYLKMHKNTLSNMRSISKGPDYTKNGGHIFYSKENLDQWKADRIINVKVGKNV